MRRDLMDILCCPVCKGDLSLKVDEENPEEVVRGTLRCANCGVDYPIEETIPNLIPPKAQ
jgi:uncharacterized protein YbaR (Trm112 family)